MNPSDVRALFVVFGATGDLTKRKLLPALHQLSRNAMLNGSHILGVGRSADMNDETFRKLTREIIGADDEWCDRCVHYRSTGDGSAERYREFASEIVKLEKAGNLSGNRVFYLALPPEAFAPTIQGIAEAGLNRSPGWTRLVIEKPFGHDLTSAQKLNALIHSYFDESQIYRIDHYLGKETVQNLLVFRFANPIFESLWNRDHIESVQITVAEELGVEQRAAYYDKTGALRDMVQNHLMQVLSLVTMEVPAMLGAEEVRDEKAKVLRSVAPIRKEDVVFGQYDGYRNEAGVDKGTRTETFVALRLNIVNWRWNRVPFYLRTGKRLPLRSSEIAIRFHRAPVSVFEPFGTSCDVRHNVLVIAIQPEEGFSLKFQVKTPGQPVALATEQLEFKYRQAFTSIPDGYETLLQDILQGDRALFVRADWIELSWKIYDALLKSPPETYAYAPGSWGPKQADDLIKRDHRHWHQE